MKLSKRSMLPVFPDRNRTTTSSIHNLFATKVETAVAETRDAASVESRGKDGSRHGFDKRVQPKVVRSTIRSTRKPQKKYIAFYGLILFFAFGYIYLFYLFGRHLVVYQQISFDKPSKGRFQMPDYVNIQDCASLNEWKRSVNSNCVPWENSATAAKFDAFLQTFLDAGWHAFPRKGSLLGAFRHKGTIPFDIDMDISVNVCEMFYKHASRLGLGPGPLGQVLQKLEAEYSATTSNLVSAIRNMNSANSSSIAFSHAIQACYELRTMEKANESDMYKYDFHGWLYDNFVAPTLPSNIKRVTATSYGVRLSNGNDNWDGGILQGQGVGADFKMPLNLPCKQKLVKGSKGTFAGDCAPDAQDVCKCTYGTTFAYCPKAAEAEILQKYNQSFMTMQAPCKYYEEIGHSNWNIWSLEECSKYEGVDCER